MSKEIKLKSVWTAGDVFIRDEHSKTLDIFIPGELFEEFKCLECGRDRIFTKAQVLEHLMKDHGLGEDEAREIWLNIEEDWTQVNSKPLFVKRGAPVPADLEGCKIYTWDEWQAIMEKGLIEGKEES